MKHLESNIESKTNNHNDETQTCNNNVNLVESQVLHNKLVENVNNVTNIISNTDGRYSKDDEDLIEQDLSDVEDNYEEPSVQRYLPGIFVDVKLKTKTMDRYGGKIAIPMIVDFYSECLKKYGEEKNFVYEESYLEHMRVKEDELWPELNKIPKNTTDPSSEFQPQTTLDNKQILNTPDQQKNVVFDENLDDVIWLKNRPNDPLLRCIRSITDRLNIQGIVGDPTSYLKKGGDDMHYDMDDPFFDDSAMLSELKMSKSDILLNRAMEREFSDWSEEEQDLDYTYVEPEDFVADYYSDFEKALRLQDVMEAEPKLIFDPAGWRVYLSKIPKQFLYIYYDFENSTKKITEPITDKMLRLKIKELLESIFKKLLKIQDFSKTSIRSKSTKSNSNKAKEKENNKEEKEKEIDLDENNGDKELNITDQNRKDNNNNKEKENKDETKLEEVVVKEEQENKDNGLKKDMVNKYDKEENEDKERENKRKLEEKKDNNKSKVVHKETNSENFKKRGLNCMMQFRILDLNGKILRWIVKSITSMTNCCSEYEIHSEWFFIVIAYNEKLIGEYSNKIKTKLTGKLQSMKPKRAETMVTLVSESSKTLSKSVGLLRKLLKEHKDLTYNKSTKNSSTKVNQETNKKKSLIEISLDSARDDHDEYMGVNQHGMETVVQDKVEQEVMEPITETPKPYKKNKKENKLGQESGSNGSSYGESIDGNNDSKDKDNKDNKDKEVNDNNNNKDKEENTTDNEEGNEMEVDKDENQEKEKKEQEDQRLSTQTDGREEMNLDENLEAEYNGSNSSNDNSEVFNNQFLDLSETHSSDSRPEDGLDTTSPMDQSEFFSEVQDNENNNNKDKEENTTDNEEGNEMEVDKDENQENKDETKLEEVVIKEQENKDNGLKKENNTIMELVASSPKKSPVQKEDDLESILKQSKIMKRIKDISSLFRLVGSDVMNLVQMNNLAISVANKINNKEFKHVVEQLGLTHNPFDQTYKRVGEIATKLIQELYNIKVNINTDVMKVVVINLQSHLKVDELYEKKSKKPLLLFSNSKIKASPGRVILNPPKDKSRKKSVQIESPKGTNEIIIDSPKSPRDVKSSPRRKNSAPPSQSRLSPTKIKDEGIQQVNEPSAKKKKTQKTSRVNSLKDLLLSRFSN